MAVHFVTLTLTLMTLSVTSLLLDDDLCPAESSKCTCVAFNVQCEGQGLTSVPTFVASPTRFTFLTLARNRITHLPPSAFSSLPTPTLDLSHNPLGANISNEAFRGLEDVLETLSLENCSLASLPPALGALRRLKSLNLRHNPLMTFLPADVMGNFGLTLEMLDFSNTGIKDWPLALKTCSRLRKVLASGNHMASIPDDALLEFSATLDYLDLSYNVMRTFPDALNEPRRLNYLDLSFNLFGTVPVGKFLNCHLTLRTLRLVHVMLREVPHGLKDLSALENLYLSYNPISSADDDVFHGSIARSLQVLHMDKTFLTSLPGALSRLVSLQELNVTWNRIRYLDNYVVNMPNLQTLFLDKNPLQNIKFAAFGGLPKLRQLYMRNTSLAYVPNSALGQTTGLTLLDISFNHFTQLFDYGFPGMNSLQELRLTGNPLTNISAHAFDDLTSLSVLDLQLCHLTFVPRAVQAMHSLRTLRMAGNDVNCTCEVLGWVERWRENEGLIAKVEGDCATYPTQGGGGGQNGNDTVTRTAATMQGFIDNEGRVC